jgi:tRNA1Val (adenine37-N6)-methyltransferase
MAFKFKKFTVEDSDCAMKVGTDSVLLGAWINYTSTANILDVGTGCGLLALIAAQNTNATITAIEIDFKAFCQAMQNFVNSSWSNRLTCINNDFRAFASEYYNQMSEDKVNDSACGFDMIISNPPYFTNSLKSSITSRNTARHNSVLPIYELIHYAKLLLKKNGHLNIVFPVPDYEQLDLVCIQEGLAATRKTFVIPRKGKRPNRVLLEYSIESPGNIEMSELTIRDENGFYTNDYLRLTNPYYLHLH